MYAQGTDLSQLPFTDTMQRNPLYRGPAGGFNPGGFSGGMAQPIPSQSQGTPYGQPYDFSDPVYRQQTLLGAFAPQAASDLMLPPDDEVHRAAPRPWSPSGPSGMPIRPWYGGEGKMPWGDALPPGSRNPFPQGDPVPGDALEFQHGRWVGAGGGSIYPTIFASQPSPWSGGWGGGQSYGGSPWSPSGGNQWGQPSSSGGGYQSPWIAARQPPRGQPSPLAGLGPSQPPSPAQSQPAPIRSTSYPTRPDSQAPDASTPYPTRTFGARSVAPMAPMRPAANRPR